MVKKFNILILTSFYPPSKGGIQTYTFEIARNFEKIGHDVTVFTISNNGIKKIFTPNSIKLIKKNKKTSIYKLFAKYDIIIASSWFPSGLIGLILSIIFKSKFYISAHGNEILYPKKYPLMNLIMKICFNHSDKIFTVSNYTKNLLIKNGILNKKIIVIPIGTDPIRFNPDIAFNDIIDKLKLKNKKIILSISRLVERKNFGIIIKVLREIIDEIPNVIYIIGGTGPMKEKWEKGETGNGRIDSKLSRSSSLQYFHFLPFPFSLITQCR